MTGKTGRHAIIEQFLADGIEYMFGNPGTVEQGFLDALEDYPDFKYIFTLQETIAVAIADGYARATKKPTLVQLHSGVGLGNGIGMMYQAKRGYAPLVVIAGESGVKYDSMDAQMAADLVSIARPVTKWATRVVDPASLLRVLRRAIKIAGTAPMGPVFVSLPMDVLDAEAFEAVVPTSFPSTRSAPQDSDIAQAVEMLAAAERPMIIMGDGVAISGAQAELTRVAELLGADVWGANSSEVNISEKHPLYRGALGHMFGTHSAPITSQADAVLIVGTYVFPEVFPALDDVFAPDAKVMHIDLDAYEIAKNFPVDLGMVADPKVALAKLADVLDSQLNSEHRKASEARITSHQEAKDRQLKEMYDADQQFRDSIPLHPSRLMEELAAHLPSDTIVFDEALTASPELSQYFPATEPGSYYQTRGGSLGVGVPGAIGLKLAHPDRTVVGFGGDGGSMYTIQALWTAAHHNIGAKFVIFNNRSYQLLKLNILEYWRERGMPEHDFPDSFDISHPDIQFDELARALGVPGVRVETADQIHSAVDEALAHDGPFLIDLVTTTEPAPHRVPAKISKSGQG